MTVEGQPSAERNPESLHMVTASTIAHSGTSKVSLRVKFFTALLTKACQTGAAIAARSGFAQGPVIVVAGVYHHHETRHSPRTTRRVPLVVPVLPKTSYPGPWPWYPFRSGRPPSGRNASKGRSLRGWPSEVGTVLLQHLAGGGVHPPYGVGLDPRTPVGEDTVSRCHLQGGDIGGT